MTTAGRCDARARCSARASSRRCLLARLLNWLIAASMAFWSWLVFDGLLSCVRGSVPALGVQRRIVFLVSPRVHWNWMGRQLHPAGLQPRTRPASWPAGLIAFSYPTEQPRPMRHAALWGPLILLDRRRCPNSKNLILPSGFVKAFANCLSVLT